VEQVEQVEQLEQPEQPEQVEQPEQPEQSEQTERWHTAHRISQAMRYFCPSCVYHYKESNRSVAMLSCKERQQVS
jgi:hypothetical protein